MRRATWVLWLMLALLPLRGWAVAGMGLPQAAQAGVAGVVAAQADGASMAGMPCHQAGDESEAGSTCQVCDWCHAAMGTPPAAVELARPLLAEAPSLVPQRDTGRPAIGGLERPPRVLRD